MKKPFDNFFIQASKPSLLKSRQFDGVTLSEAIESAFPEDTEYAFLFWARTSLSLSYKYDLSNILTDLPNLANLLLKSSGGSYISNWPTIGFNWRFDWTQSALTIESFSQHPGWWDVLAEAGPVKSDVKSFLAEMQRPAMICHRALTSLNYSAQNVEGMGDLEDFLRIPLPRGFLYK